MTEQRAFSLIEVIVAVALFATSVTVILALLPSLSQRGAETVDRSVAQGMSGGIKVELDRLAANGIGALAARIPVMGGSLQNGLALVASRDGGQLHAQDYLPPASARIAVTDRYFLIECWRFPDGPLRFEPAASALALVVRVSWPYHAPGTSAVVPVESRHELVFTMGINR